MQKTSLLDLIKSLEYGTNIHISVTFLNDIGNYMTTLPFEKAIHSKPFCMFMKSTKKGYDKCYECRCMSLKKATEFKQAFGGFCFNGVWEYCYPVIYENTTIAVIMIGNILKRDSEIQNVQYFDTFEKDYPESNCALFAEIISQHIKMLIRIYGSSKTEENLFVSNIKNYISEWLYTDISLKSLSSVFGYNEKYLGKFFKKNTGFSIKEYVNYNRLQNAALLLEETELTIIEISARCGYNNVTYFNRIFKKEFNTTPKEYRKSNKFVGEIRQK